MNRNRFLLFIQSQTLPLSMHHLELLILYAKRPMKNHRGPTLNESPIARGVALYIMFENHVRS